jgi:nucleotide-binding universal stress UspA family protein
VLVVCFIREVALSYKVEAEGRLTLDTDPAAQQLFADFLEHGHRHGVPIIPVYDTGHNGPELIAEQAAMNGVAKVLIGSSRRGTLHHLIKGSFQRRLESLLPPEIMVEVIGAPPPSGTPETQAA